MEHTYRIVRHYKDTNHPDHLKDIKTGLTIEAAWYHYMKYDTYVPGVWFDEYEKE